MKAVCVFCGSSPGHDPAYVAGAEKLGQLLANQRIKLVYGGGKVGLMGTLADAVLTAGGNVIGVIPQFLMDKEIGHTGLTELIVVDSMHARKAKMAELTEGFIAMPGGFGTFEELFEVVTWAQLALHHKPIGILNTAGYYDHMLAFLERAIEDQFIATAYQHIMHVSSDPGTLIEMLKKHPMPLKEKWTDKLT